MLDTIGITTQDIFAAAERIQAVALRTPLLYNPYLSSLYGCHLSLKAENLQRTGAFKLRGAYNKIAKLTDDERARGLITASSGNHAQGVAYASRKFGIDHCTTIFVPESTPQTKIQNARKHGQVQIELVSGTYDDASRTAHAEAERTGATYIEPYDDWDIIAGQGTIGLEIMQDAPETDVILVPVGGGGLITGITLGAQAVRPDVRVIGVGATYRNPSGDTVADGIRVKRAGYRPHMVLNDEIDSITRIDEATIERAIFDLLQNARLLVEGAGAVGFAAIMAGVLRFTPETKVVVVLSGGNMDMGRLQGILAAHV